MLQQYRDYQVKTYDREHVRTRTHAHTKNERDGEQAEGINLIIIKSNQNNFSSFKRENGNNAVVGIKALS